MTNERILQKLRRTFPSRAPRPTAISRHQSSNLDTVSILVEQPLWPICQIIQFIVLQLPLPALLDPSILASILDAPGLGLVAESTFDIMQVIDATISTCQYSNPCKEYESGCNSLRTSLGLISFLFKKQEIRDL